MKLALAASLLLLALGCATTQTAKISHADAERTAIGRAPNGTVKQSELERENGRLVWSFDITTPGTNDVTEVKVNAVNGDVVSVENETPPQQQAETTQDRKK